jgi:uncharacterized protein (TIRG00374 family)
MLAKKKNLIGGVLLLALMVLTMYHLLRGKQLSQIFTILTQVKLGWIFAGVALMFVFVACEASCTRFTLRYLGHDAGRLRCLGYAFVGFYFSSITPSSTGGQPAQIYYMSKDGIPAAHGTLSMLLDTACYQVAILLCAGVALLFRPGLLTAMGTGLGLLLVLGAAIMLVFTVAMLLFMFLPNAAQRLADRILALLVRTRLVKDGERWRARLEHQMEEYHAGADCILHNPIMTIRLLLITLFQLACQFAVPYTVYRALGLVGHGAFEIICAQALLTLAVSMLPLPGAVGVTEGGFVRFFAVFFGTRLVTPAVLLSRGVSFYAFLALSALATLVVHLTTRRPLSAPDPSSP